MNEEVEKKYILDMAGHYSDTVMDHARNPRNVGNIADCNGYGQDEGECGDTLAIWLSVKNNRITNATFWSDVCGTSIACASMVTELSKNKTVDEASRISPQKILSELGGLPEDHVHCADLAANTLKKALDNYLETDRFPWKKAYYKASSK